MTTVTLGCSGFRSALSPQDTLPLVGLCPGVLACAQGALEVRGLEWDAYLRLLAGTCQPFPNLIFSFSKGPEG